MPRPKPTIQSVPVLLRLHPATVAEIDKHRGETPRNRWVAWLVNGWLADQMPRLPDAQVGEIMRELGDHGPKDRDRKVVIKQRADALGDGRAAANGPSIALQFGPTKSKPGERLKKR